jgi:hypothetical protein
MLRRQLLTILAGMPAAAVLALAAKPETNPARIAREILGSGIDQESIDAAAAICDTRVSEDLTALVERWVEGVAGNAVANISHAVYGGRGGARVLFEEGGRPSDETLHIRSNVAISQIVPLLESAALTRFYIAPAEVAIAEKIVGECTRNPRATDLTFFGLPLAIRGLGVFQVTARRGSVLVRATLSYDPTSLSMQLTLDTLFAVA